MQINSATSANSSSLAYLNTSTTVARSPKQALGQEDFLKLLSVQFQQQDPMKPMDDTAFIAQTAQFTSLQQMTQLAKDQQLLAGGSYIGRSVTVKDADGKSVTGLVSALDNSGDSPALVINGTSYPLSTVKRVESAPPPSTNVTPQITTENQPAA